MQSLAFSVMLAVPVKDDTVALTLQPQIFHPEIIPVLGDQRVTNKAAVFHRNA
jgi:hypothetical protein